MELTSPTNDRLDREARTWERIVASEHCPTCGRRPSLAVSNTIVKCKLGHRWRTTNRRSAQS